MRLLDWLAGAGGLEPPNGGIKIRCLTTWLRPIGLPPRRADHSGAFSPDQRSPAPRCDMRRPRPRRPIDFRFPAAARPKLRHDKGLRALWPEDARRTRGPGPRAGRTFRRCGLMSACPLTAAQKRTSCDFRVGLLSDITLRWQWSVLVRSMLPQVRFGSHQMPGTSRHRTRAA